MGRPTIQYFTNPDSGEGLDSDDAFINIPHIDPGRDKYGTQDPRLRRVLDMSMQMSFLLGHTAMQVLDNHGQFSNRRELCVKILFALDEFLSYGPGKTFEEAFDQAKVEFRQWFGQATT